MKISTVHKRGVQEHAVITKELLSGHKNYNYRWKHWILKII
jgi:hypothetical protein